MKKSFFLVAVLNLLLLLAACSAEKVGGWNETDQMSTRVWISSLEPDLSYSWEGETFDSVAHGKGILRILKGDSLIEERELTAYYGSISDDDIIQIAENEKYLGSVKDEKFDGYGVYHKNGDLYIGNFKESKPHGFLTWYKDGKPYYVGMWVEGNFHGEGTLYKEDGSIKYGDWENGKLVQTLVDVDVNIGHYNGYVKNNKPDGIGIMKYSDGSVYSGKWKNGFWNGNGYYTSANQDTITSVWSDGFLDGPTVIKGEDFYFEGEYLLGFPHGLSLIEIPNLYTYIGYYGNGERSGYGEIEFSSGDSYKGDWENNLFDGDGVYIYQDAQAKYDGQWSEGLQDGIGIYECPEFTYEGEWEEGWINGYGKIVFANKDEYVGNFVENKFYGEGTYLFSNGNRYEGEFVDGKFNGLGSFYFANGDSYVGEFKDGDIHGDGTMIIYEDGKPITITANWPGGNKFPKVGSILFANGDVYEGELENGIPTEKGKWTTEEAIAKNVSLADKANDFYKEHKEDFEKIKKALTYITIGVAVAAAVVTVAVAVATTGGAAAPAALVATSKVLAVAATTLEYANTTAYVASMTASAASAAQDYKNADSEEEKSAILNETTKNLVIDAAFLLLPKFAKSSAARSAKVALSSGIKDIGKKTLVKIPQGKTFGKIVTVAKNKAGVLEKKMTTTSQKIAQSTVQKGKEKFQSMLLGQLIKKTKLNKELQAIVAKGPITLSDKNLKELLDNPNYIRAYITTYTGNKNNFQEFFIRLAMGNKKQVQEILNNPTIYDFVKRSIRQSKGGGYHEWLMTKNFSSFLLDSKWGEDGPFLALALTKLVQGTNRVMFKNGGAHVRGNIVKQSTESVQFHKRLAKTIDSCSSKEELFVKVRAFAKKELTPEAFIDFNNIFKEVFMLTE